MKHTIYLIIFIYFINPIYAQTGEADSATMYLTGTFKKYSPQRAFQINLQNANSGNAKAMNALAIQYMKGLGIDSNFNLAVYWFNQAATNNYTKSLVNLGMLYKHKASDSLGYSLACDYFNQALQVGEPSALFAQGYMLYKGLGCTQSYTAALALFNQGIALNQANCMYFKGLCYKFGYGVNENIDSANYYISKAALRGYKQANAELSNNSVAARGTKNIHQFTKKTHDVTNEYSRIAKTNNQIKFNGEFIGEMLQFDYSGKKLLAQIPIKLELYNSQSPSFGGVGEAAIVRLGTLQLNNNKPFNIQAIQQGNQLIFSQTAIPLSLGRGVRGEAKLIFKTATLNLETKNDSSFLTGSLQLFNTRTHETDKPINIKLAQLKTTNEINNKQETRNVVIFPNPTTSNFTVSFTLSKPSAAKINIYNPQGKLVYTKIFDNLQAGKQNIPIVFNTPLQSREVGIHTVNIVTNQFKQTTAFIKE